MDNDTNYMQVLVLVLKIVFKILLIGYLRILKSKSNKFY